MPPFDLVERLGGPAPRAIEDHAPFLIERGEGDAARLRDFAALRRRAFVHEQELFNAHDEDEFDRVLETRVLVAVTPHDEVVGGVRLHPAGEDPSLGWWRGSRLVCSPAAGALRGAVGAALVRAACAQAVDAGALRFDAHVQPRHLAFFARLGWREVRPIEVAGAPHVLMRWEADRIECAAASSKACIGPTVQGLLQTPDGWLGDDGVPVEGTRVFASTDAITPSMVERDPAWAGWCGMLVTAHDLAAMGAAPRGALDSLGARDVDHARRVARGLRAGSQAFRLPILGGHTQLGVPAALAVTGLGETARPVSGAGGGAGDALTVTADLDGGWRAGYHASQWDSTTARSREELGLMLDAVGRAQPRAAKDVSMAGIAGTVGMLAESSGCGAELEVSAIPRPGGVGAADWLTCFPGFAMVTADLPGAAPLGAGPALGAECGRLEEKPGVRLRWPDGDLTTALQGAVTGLGSARRPAGLPSRCDPTRSDRE